MTFMRPIPYLVKKGDTMRILMSVFLGERVSFTFDPSIARHRCRFAATL